MLPTITVFHKTIAMYGLMAVLGVFTGVTIAILRRRTYHFEKDDILFASCYAGIGLILGAKVLYLLTILPKLIENWEFFISDIANLYQILSGGFVFYGGFLGAALGFYIYCQQYHIDVIKMLDFFAPVIPIIHGIGRIGCFFAGCCYGISYNGPLHVLFQHSPAAPNGIPLFPIQLVESICNLSVGILLLLYAKPERRPGKMIGLYITSYAALRFALEFLRGDTARGSFLSLSTSQWISLLLLPAGILLFLGIRQNRNKP